MNAPLPAQGLIAATPLTETSFSVPGMRCAACISKLETGLPRTAGIVSARVNLTAKRVAIAHLPALTPPELQAAIAGLGFEAQPLGQALASDTADDSRELLRAMAVAVRRPEAENSAISPKKAPGPTDCWTSGRKTSPSST